MDFGSSHVYAGDPYYSDVPTEEESSTSQSEFENPYESVSEMYYNAKERHFPITRANSQPIYDPVYESSLQEEKQKYDQVYFGASESNAQPQVTKAKPELSKKSLSSSVLHKAMFPFKEKKVKKKKPHQRNVSGKCNKPLPPLPIAPQMHVDTRPELPPPRIPPKPKIYQSVPDAQQAKCPGKLNETIPTISPTAPAYETNMNELRSSLYPRLPNSNTQHRDITETLFQSNLVASAPTTVSEQPLVSAPLLSASMVNHDSRTSKNGTKNMYAVADTNVVSVKLGILQQQQNSMMWAMPPIKCQNCEAVLLHHALSENQNAAVCRFCENQNQTVAAEVLPLVGNESDITYVVDQQSPAGTEDSIIVFCIDTSGSMCVTSEVQRSCFMSRLQGVREGILNQLNLLKQTKPQVRVAFVTFSSEVTLLGDGSPEQYLVLNDAQMYDTDYIKAVGSSVVTPGSVCNTYAQLRRTVEMFTERGGTALGPALLLSISLASRKFGSQVIVCTDGRANIGMGSLETEAEYKMCHAFYKETSEYSAEKGTIVSILSIKGTDCRLVELGKVADKTAGKVKIASLDSLSQDFCSIISNPLMATNVSVSVVAQKELYFNESADNCQSLVKNFVGNATPDTEVTFKYGIKDTPGKKSLQEALFQLQVSFFLPNGRTCLRVITQTRPVTENPLVAEEGLNPSVVGTYASQLASKLVLDGELLDAKLTTDAHKNLITRALSVRSNRSVAQQNQYALTDERIYSSACTHMDELNTEIDRVTQSLAAGLSTTAEADHPPALPARLPLSSCSRSVSRSFSITSLRLPDVPDTALARKDKIKEAVENCPDEVASKLYKHRKACGKMFTAS